MPKYLISMKLTKQGAKTIKEAPSRIEAGIKGFEKMGGKVHSFHSLMGEYDCAAMGEAPGDEVVATFSFALCSLGNVKTAALRAFTKSFTAVAAAVLSLGRMHDRRNWRILMMYEDLPDEKAEKLIDGLRKEKAGALERLTGGKMIVEKYAGRT